MHLPQKYFLLLLFVISSVCFSEPRKGKIIIDTVKVEKIKAPQNEDLVFNDPAFNFKEEEIKRGKNFIKDLWNWLVRGNRFKLEDPVTERERKGVSKKNSPGFWSTDVVTKIVILLACLTLLATLIYLVASGKLKKIFAQKPLEASFDFNEIKENIKDINIEKLISDAVRAGNFRLATRWSYLKILKKLALADKIIWQPYKTNLDYYYELADSPYLNEFKNASKIYDYVWYGELTVNEVQYLDYLPVFSTLENSIDA